MCNWSYFVALGNPPSQTFIPSRFFTALWRLATWKMHRLVICRHCTCGATFFKYFVLCSDLICLELYFDVSPPPLSSCSRISTKQNFAFRHLSLPLVICPTDRAFLHSWIYSPVAICLIKLAHSARDLQTISLFIARGYLHAQQWYIFDAVQFCSVWNTNLCGLSSRTLAFRRPSVLVRHAYQ